MGVLEAASRIGDAQGLCATNGGEWTARGKGIDLLPRCLLIGDAPQRVEPLERLQSGPIQTGGAKLL